MALPRYQQSAAANFNGVAELNKQGNNLFSDAMDSFGDVVDQKVEYETKQALNTLRGAKDLAGTAEARKGVNLDWVNTEKYDTEADDMESIFKADAERERQNEYLLRQEDRAIANVEKEDLRYDQEAALEAEEVRKRDEQRLLLNQQRVKQNEQADFNFALEKEQLLKERDITDRTEQLRDSSNAYQTGLRDINAQMGDVAAQAASDAGGGYSEAAMAGFRDGINAYTYEGVIDVGGYMEAFREENGKASPENKKTEAQIAAITSSLHGVNRNAKKTRKTWEDQNIGTIHEMEDKLGKGRTKTYQQQQQKLRQDGVLQRQAREQDNMQVVSFESAVENLADRDGYAWTGNESDDFGNAFTDIQKNLMNGPGGGTLKKAGYSATEAAQFMQQYSGGLPKSVINAMMKDGSIRKWGITWESDLVKAGEKELMRFLKATRGSLGHMNTGANQMNFAAANQPDKNPR